MQKRYVVNPVMLLFMLAGCSKMHETYVKQDAPVMESRFNRICTKWQLKTYTIKTDLQDYVYTGTDLDEHALKTMTLNKNLTYKSENDLWSGRFAFGQDSAAVLFTPFEPGLIPFSLHIDGITIDQLFLSSPAVTVNPEKPTSDAYEKFVAYEGLHWLYEHQVDIKNLKSVQIEFLYAHQ